MLPSGGLGVEDGGGSQQQSCIFSGHFTVFPPSTPPCCTSPGSTERREPHAIQSRLLLGLAGPFSVHRQVSVGSPISQNRLPFRAVPCGSRKLRRSSSCSEGFEASVATCTVNSPRSVRSATCTGHVLKRRQGCLESRCCYVRSLTHLLPKETS